MKSLKDATRSILLETPMFSIAKEGYEVEDDHIGIFDFLEKDKEFTERNKIKNQQHVEKLAKDKTVLKRYYSSEMPNNLKYLALMSLGLEWLLFNCEMDDINEAREILYKKINEERAKLIN